MIEHHLASHKCCQGFPLQRHIGVRGAGVFVMHAGQGCICRGLWFPNLHKHGIIVTKQSLSLTQLQCRDQSQAMFTVAIAVVNTSQFTIITLATACSSLSITTMQYHYHNPLVLETNLGDWPGVAGDDQDMQKTFSMSRIVLCHSVSPAYAKFSRTGRTCFLQHAMH